MAQTKKTAIVPTRSENYPEWYQKVVRAADLAENSPVKGCMVIKPWGYALWEKVQEILNKKFKETGHQNAYFPIFIPKSFFEKEAQHVDGFAKECAVVTHHRLEEGVNGELVPAGKLNEPYIVRPTSETIIGAMFSKWISSYRDLPLLINQWANVVRWEMRTRIFLRTTEFLWQEGHTAHATLEEAEIETNKMLNVYHDFMHDYMAIPVIKGEKTESERFPGAIATFTVEAMMQDRKALQAGTSHSLGQNFSKTFDIKYLDKEGNDVYAWTTSWGVSTRLIGALIMAHGDDDGIIIPPRMAQTHIVIIPIIRGEDTENEVMEFCQTLANELKEQTYDRNEIGVELDKRDMRGGDKVWSWIKKGVPIRLEIGPRDVKSNSVFMGRRDKGTKDKQSISKAEFIEKVPEILTEMQNNIYNQAVKFQQEHTHKIDDKDEFYKFFTPKNKENPEIHGGYALTHWCGDPEVEEKIKNDLGVTIRCIPEGKREQGTCPFSNKQSKGRVIFAKSY